MEVSPITVSATSTCSSTLVISPDPYLAHQLRRILEEDHRRRVQVACSFREAEAILQDGMPEAVFVDFRAALPERGDAADGNVCGREGQGREAARKPGAAEGLPALLNHLVGRARRRVPVIAVSDAGYVCDWAVVADLIVSGHVQLPLDRRQLSRLLQYELAQKLSPAVPGSFTPRVVDGKTMTFKTFTPEMSSLLDDLVTMAGHAVTVLLVGETGTGKTALARLIHELSPRREARLLVVGCGALPPELIESELFGHVKGAFTGADRTKLGKFEAAENGTLLLDEIDVLGPGQQAKLLRVIETGEFEPVGSNDTRRSSARLVVASNVDLKQLVERNQFRADLYYRLNMLELRIPPLRQRPHDIVLLTLDFIDEFCSAHGVRIQRVHPEFLACLKQYHWPGNVRELKNHVRRAVLFCSSGVLTPNELAPHFRQLLDQQPAPPPSDPPGALHGDPGEMSFVQQVATSERRILEQALRDHDHNRTETAKALGLSRVGLYKKMKKLGMVAPRGKCTASS